MPTIPPLKSPDLAAENASATDASVGAQIRHFRRARGWSLREMAQQTGLSVGLLSQIERGLSSASMRTLALAGDALGVGVADFFADTAAKDLRIVTRVSERGLVQFGTEEALKELLTVHGEARGLELYLIRLGPEGSSGKAPYSHRGIESGYVISGGFELQVDGHTYLMGEGDSCSFASTRQHRFKNAGQREALVLWANFRKDINDDTGPNDDAGKVSEDHETKENLP